MYFLAQGNKTETKVLASANKKTSPIFYKFMNNSVFGKFIENVSGCGAESKSSGDGLRAAEDRRKVVAVFGRRASGFAAVHASMLAVYILCAAERGLGVVGVILKRAIRTSDTNAVLYNCKLIQRHLQPWDMLFSTHIVNTVVGATSYCCPYNIIVTGLLRFFIR